MGDREGYGSDASDPINAPHSGRLVEVPLATPLPSQGGASNSLAYSPR